VVVKPFPRSESEFQCVLDPIWVQAHGRNSYRCRCPKPSCFGNKAFTICLLYFYTCTEQITCYCRFISNSIALRKSPLASNSNHIMLRSSDFWKENAKTNIQNINLVLFIAYYFTQSIQHNIESPDKLEKNWDHSKCTPIPTSHQCMTASFEPIIKCQD